MDRSRETLDDKVLGPDFNYTIGTTVIEIPRKVVTSFAEFVYNLITCTPIPMEESINPYRCPGTNLRMTNKGIRGGVAYFSELNCYKY